MANALNFTHEIAIGDYDYTLPDGAIAKHPLPTRDNSKLLICDKEKALTIAEFKNLHKHIPAGHLLVFNNTRVIHARLIFKKASGARIEIFCLNPHTPSDMQLAFHSTRECTWNCLVGNGKRWKSDYLTQEVSVKGLSVQLTALLVEKGEMQSRVKFEWNTQHVTFGEILQSAGSIPIPPYLGREAVEGDKIQYQTVYSTVEGSVAAPTAGLHFTSDVLLKMNASGIKRAELTLHVGAGTFQPVKGDDVRDHEMHGEYFEFDSELLDNLIYSTGNVVSVGTTSARSLESIYWMGVKIFENTTISPSDLWLDQWEPYQLRSDISAADSLHHLKIYMEKNGLTKLTSMTRVIIVPGYQFKVINGLITNFHLPKSTLLLLVSAFIGESWKNVYAFALANGFRFLSYGDSSLLWRD